MGFPYLTYVESSSIDTRYVLMYLQIRKRDANHAHREFSIAMLKAHSSFPISI